MFLLILVFVIGLVLGAFSHKWLAKETGAPANLSVDAAVKAAQDVAKKV